MNNIVKFLIQVLLVPSLVLGILQTPPAKRLVASELSRRASQSDNLTIKMGRISELSPMQVEVDSIEVGDRNGTWLTFKKVHCRWSVKELFKGIVKVKQFGADSIELHRLPVAGKKNDAPKEKKERKPLEFVLENLAIKKLVLGEAVVGVPLEYAVYSGGIRLHKAVSSLGSCWWVVMRGGRFRFLHPHSV